MTQPAGLRMWYQTFNSTNIVLWEYIHNTHCIFMIYSPHVWIIKLTKSRWPCTLWTVKYYSDTDAVRQVPELSDVPDSPLDVIKKVWALCYIKNTTKILFVCKGCVSMTVLSLLLGEILAPPLVTDRQPKAVTQVSWVSTQRVCFCVRLYVRFICTCRRCWR